MLNVRFKKFKIFHFFICSILVNLVFMALSYGFIETQGLIGSIEAADAMLKAAKVRLIQRREIGFGLVTIIVEGELAAVMASVEAGRMAAEAVGQFVTSHVIPNPFEDTSGLILGRLFVAEEKTLISKAEKEVKSVKEIPAKETPSPKLKAKKTDKSQKPEKTERSGDSRKEIQKIVAKYKNGVTLEEIASALKRDPDECRIVLKELIDKEKIEKVKNRYFTI